MNNNLNKKKDNFTSTPAESDEIATYFQLKKMKRWIGANELDAYDDEGGPVSYGDGHSGWNR